MTAISMNYTLRRRQSSVLTFIIVSLTNAAMSLDSSTTPSSPSFRILRRSSLFLPDLLKGQHEHKQHPVMHQLAQFRGGTREESLSTSVAAAAVLEARPKAWMASVRKATETTERVTVRLRAPTDKSILVSASSTESNLIAVLLTSQNLLRAFILVTTVVTLVMNRHHLAPWLDSQRLQQTMLTLVQRLEPTDPKDTWKSLTCYALGMAVWELVGLSTIPVETAAAMVFGWQALLPSAVGKLLGATCAYVLGRTILSQWARRRLADNKVFQLLESGSEAIPPKLTKVQILRQRFQSSSASADPVLFTSHDKLDVLRTPLATAFLMKFSCFPEFIKNFGSSLLQPVTLQRFVVVTIVHGWMYTALWTFLGVDTAFRLQTTDVLPANHLLRVSLGLSVVVGFVLSPLLMAWWIRDLKLRSAADAAAAAAKRTSIRNKILLVQQKQPQQEYARTR
jgi:hypothetical protein